MLKIILILIWSSATFAGVGGIDGGSVHFQKNSTWVNMVYSKKLCFKNDTFFSPSRKCVKWDRHSDDKECIKYKPIVMKQPKFSTRQRCHKSDDDGCKEWITVPYVQKRNKLVKFLDEDNNIIKIEKLRIKGCK